MGTSNVKITDILSITNVKPKDSYTIESCGEFNDQLNGYFIMLNDSKVGDLIDYVILSFGDNYAQLLKDILATNDEEDIAQTVNTINPDVDKSYTDLFLEEFGTTTRIKNFVDQQNMMTGVTPPSEEQPQIQEETTDEELMLSPNNIKPEEVSEPNSELEKEVIDLESKLEEEKNLTQLLTLSKKELEDKIDSLNAELKALKDKYENTKVPDFAVDSLIDTIGTVAEDATRDSVIMLIQNLTSSNSNYVLAKLVEGLVTNYLELEAIEIEQEE